MEHYTTPGRMVSVSRRLAWWLVLVLCVALPSLGEAAVDGIPCSPEPTNMTISYGDTVTCAIDVIGDTDVFRFSGSAGETVVVQASRLNGGHPCVELFRPDGTRLGSHCPYNSSSARIDAALDQRSW